MRNATRKHNDCLGQVRACVIQTRENVKISLCKPTIETLLTTHLSKSRRQGQAACTLSLRLAFIALQRSSKTVWVHPASRRTLLPAGLFSLLTVCLCPPGNRPGSLQAARAQAKASSVHDRTGRCRPDIRERVISSLLTTTVKKTWTQIDFCTPHAQGRLGFIGLSPNPCQLNARWLEYAN